MEVLGFILAAVGVLAIVFLIARYQSNRYQAYLDQQVAETRGIAESQRRTLEAIERQTIAMERIANALEMRG
jgi:hypothetical protein